MQPQPAIPVAVSCFIVDDRKRFLLFSRDGQTWRVMGGQLEARETIPECIEREIQEELGEIQYRMVDVLDTHVFAYPGLGNIVSIFCLLKYEGGVISLASDMSEYAFEWIDAEQVLAIDLQCPFQRELVEKAIHTIREFERHPDLSFWKFKWKSLS